jgi:dTMP kinase
MAGLFVTFEGIDRSGKTTQASMLCEALGGEALAVREPGGTPLGDQVRRLVLGPEHDVGAAAEALLFMASRAELVERVIRPALDRGVDVVCDRFIDSSLAYQGIARGLGLEAVLELNLTVLGGLLPDRTFVLAVDAVEAAGRRDDAPDKIEREGIRFQAEVGRAYEQLAGRFPERVELLDGEVPPAELAASVRARLQELL